MKDNEKAYKNIVANFSTRSEKTSWIRKRKNLETYVTENITPIETELQELKILLQPLYDHIQVLRQEMVKTCIHPQDELRMNADNTVTCTFCSKTFNPKPIGNSDVG